MGSRLQSTWSACVSKLGFNPTATGRPRQVVCRGRHNLLYSFKSSVRLPRRVRVGADARMMACLGWQQQR